MKRFIKMLLGIEQAKMLHYHLYAVVSGESTYSKTYGVDVPMLISVKKEEDIEKEVTRSLNEDWTNFLRSHDIYSVTAFRIEDKTFLGYY